jgi:hypothetical protein
MGRPRFLKRRVVHGIQRLKPLSAASGATWRAGHIQRIEAPPRTASRPVKLQRPGEGRRVQSLRGTTRTRYRSSISLKHRKRWANQESVKLRRSKSASYQFPHLQGKENSYFKYTAYGIPVSDRPGYSGAVKRSPIEQGWSDCALDSCSSPMLLSEAIRREMDRRSARVCRDRGCCGRHR